MLDLKENDTPDELYKKLCECGICTSQEMDDDILSHCARRNSVPFNRWFTILQAILHKHEEIPYA